MADKLVKTRVQMKRGTKADWDAATAAGFKPLEGEYIFYSDLNKIKVGKKDADGNLLSLDDLEFLNAEYADEAGDADTLDGKHASDFALKSEVPESFAPVDAEKNVQSDWNVTDTTSDAFIKNKPTIPTKSSWNYDDTYVKYSVTQSLTDAQKSTARANIGAGTSSFSGNYNDLTNKPTIPVDTNTTYDLAAPVSKTNGNVTIDLTAGGSGSGTDSVKIKGSGATTVTTDANGVITISSTDTNTQDGNDNQTVKVKEVSFEANDVVELKEGSNVTITADKTAKTITINATDTTYTALKNPNALDFLNSSGTEVDDYDGSSSVKLKAGSNVEMAAANGTVTITAKDTTYSEVVANGAAGLMSGADKAKLDGVAAGAEVNVQSDWNQADNTKDDFIKNKPTAIKNPKALSIGGKSYDGSSEVSVTAAELRTHLGLNNALHFIGLTTTTIADNSTTTTITVDGKSHTAVAGDVVLYNDNEYVFDGSKWLELGDGSSHALKTNTVTAGKGLTDGGQIGSNPTLNVGAGEGITVNDNDVAHSVPSGAKAETRGSTADRTYIKTVTTDKFGHVTGVTTGTEEVTNTDTWRKVQLNGVDKLGTGTNTNPLNIKAGNNVTITESNGTFTFSATDTNTDTNTTYDLEAPASKTNGNVTIDLKAGGSGSGTDSVKIKGSGATTVTTDTNGVIIISSTDTDTDTNTAHTHEAGVGLAFADTQRGGKEGTVTYKAKLKNETALTEDSSAATTTSGRVYPVAVDKSGYLAVNVPWTDTNTQDGNDNQTVKGNGTAFDKNAAVNFVGGGATTVTANTTNSQITISSTDTGATSVEVTGTGNVVTAASYNASTRKLTLTKGATSVNIDTVKTEVSTQINTLISSGTDDPSSSTASQYYFKYN